MVTLCTAGGRKQPGFAGSAAGEGAAVAIWICVLPTLTAINLTFANWLGSMSAVARTFVLATIAVPIVIYGLMPQLQRARARLLSAHGG